MHPTENRGALGMIQPQTCGVCGKVLEVAGADASKLFPFCSDRCRNIDLYRWTEGKYAIIEPLDPEDTHAEYDRRPDEDL